MGAVKLRSRLVYRASKVRLERQLLKLCGPRVEPVRAAGWPVGIFWLGSLLTARSECHVSCEAAVIGNGTLHGGRVSFRDKAQRFEHL